MRRGTAADVTTDLEYKRSFFVRMVSDPKIYNPKIVAKSVTMSEAEPIAESLTAENHKESQWAQKYDDYRHGNDFVDRLRQVFLD